MNDKITYGIGGFLNRRVFGEVIDKKTELIADYKIEVRSPPNIASSNEVLKVFSESKTRLRLVLSPKAYLAWSGTSMGQERT